MKYSQLKHFLNESSQLNEFFGGRGTLFHGTDPFGAALIKKSRSFTTSNVVGGYGDYDGPGDDITYISFARSRGTAFGPPADNGVSVYYEFKKNVLRRNTKREKASFEPYDDFEMEDGGRYKGGRNTNFYNYDEPTARSKGDHEMEDRLWFKDGRDSSSGVFNSIDKMHIVFVDGPGEVDPDELETILDDIELRGVDTLFYKSNRDWIQGKVLFDPFEQLGESYEIGTDLYRDHTRYMTPGERPLNERRTRAQQSQRGSGRDPSTTPATSSRYFSTPGEMPSSDQQAFASLFNPTEKDIDKFELRKGVGGLNVPQEGEPKKMQALRMMQNRDQMVDNLQPDEEGVLRSTGRTFAPAPPPELPLPKSRPPLRTSWGKSGTGPRGTGKMPGRHSVLGHLRDSPTSWTLKPGDEGYQYPGAVNNPAYNKMLDEQLNESFLTELFDRPYRWQTRNMGGRDVADAAMEAGVVTYTFKTDEGDSVVVEFNYYEDVDGDQFVAEFRRQGRYDVTGGGDAPRIFATVIDIMKHFVQEVQPDMLTFSADVDFKNTGVPGEEKENRSRIKLYSRMVQRFARRLGYQYSSKSDYNGTSQTYHIWK